MKEEFYAFPYAIILPANESVIRRGEVSMVETANERVLIAYANHAKQEQNGISPIEGDNNRASICGTLLNSNGEVCSQEWILIECNSDNLNVMSPALRRISQKRIAMLYSNRISKTKAQRMFVYSDDEGESWSNPITIALNGYITGCHDRFTILSSGRFIAPLHKTNNWDDHYLQAIVAYSDDEGQSWKLSNTLELPRVQPPLGWADTFIESGCIEPGVIELEDGNLLMVIRTAMGTLFSSRSIDQGITWSDPVSMEVISPQAPAHLSRIPDTSDLLLVWTPLYSVREHLGGRRTALMVAISKDNGVSWPHEQRKLLINDPNHAVDYPAILYRKNELWIAFRYSTTPNILKGLTSTALMKVPIEFIYES